MKEKKGISYRIGTALTMSTFAILLAVPHAYAEPVALCNDPYYAYGGPVGGVGTWQCYTNDPTGNYAVHCGDGVWVDDNNSGTYDEGDDEFGVCANTN